MQRAGRLPGRHRGPGREQRLRDQATAEGTPRLCLAAPSVVLLAAGVLIAGAANAAFYVARQS